MLAVARLHLRQIFAGKRRWILSFALCAPWAILALIASNARFNDELEFRLATGTILFAFYAIGVPALTALLYGTSILGAEVQNQTLTYLFTRPIARWRVVIGKYLANVSVLGIGTLLSLGVGWLILGQPRIDNLVAVTAASITAVLAYNAVFALVGSMFTRRSIVAGLVYIGVSEIALANVPSFARNFTAQYHTRSIAFELSGLESILPIRERALIADNTALGGVTALALITALTLVATCWITTSREFALTDDA